MVFSVTRKASEFVAPAEATPTDILYLSVIDRIKGLRYLVQSIHVFETGESAAKTIKQALAKALVHYYPMAGRFVDDCEDGEVKLACTGEGVWFVEAVADCSLEDVRFLDHPLMIEEDELLPVVSQEIKEKINVPLLIQWKSLVGCTSLCLLHTLLDHPLMISEDELLPLASQEIKEKINVPFLIQVTEFTCGGFAFGLTTVHTMSDGLGVAQFIQTIAEMAQGLKKPTINPIWARDIIPNPPKLLKPGPPPTFPDYKLQNTTIDLPADSILHLKADFLHSTGKHCSTFDASVAKVWQARARAARFEPDEPVHVCFFANARHLLVDALPPAGGYYGNCFYPITVTTTAGIVAQSSLVDVVRIIRDAKSGLAKDFKKWAIGDFKLDPYQLIFNYNSLFVSDWTRLGFREVDYGWGKPIHVIPFAYDEFMVMAVIGTLPVPRQGTRIMTQCVKTEHLQEFLDEMRKT